MIKKILVAGLLLSIVVACKVEPEPINYGTDVCEYCHMTIVDRQHAAEIVTVKGRAYKFDAIECMMNYLNTTDHDEIKLYLINGYDNPGVLTDAITATYLISEEIYSPMGANLSGFSTKEAARSVQKEHGGEIYSWKQLKDLMKLGVSCLAYPCPPETGTR